MADIEEWDLNSWATLKETEWPNLYQSSILDKLKRKKNDLEENIADIIKDYKVKIREKI